MSHTSLSNPGEDVVLPITTYHLVVPVSPIRRSGVRTDYKISGVCEIFPWEMNFSSPCYQTSVFSFFLHETPEEIVLLGDPLSS